MKRLEGKNILITGASKGLGRSILLECARRGANVAFTYNSDEKAAGETEQLANDLGVQSKSFKASVLNFEEHQKIGKWIEDNWGSIDILINNAGVSEFLPVALMNKEDWDKTLNINLDGTFLVTKAILPFMVKRKTGSILNISSLAGVRILAAPVDYCSSKAGVKGFTESLSKEVGRYNIRVNCVAPGILEEGVARGIPENKVRDFIDQLSLHRIGTFDEIARCCSFLVSDLNSYMTGNTIILDGGL